MHRSATDLLAATVAAAGLLALGACASATRARPAPIDPHVLETVRSADSVGVVVVLATPPSYYRGDSGRLRNDIRGMQDAVLDALEPGAFRVRHRFQSIPAMTLVVFDESTIRALALRKQVERIDFDDGSGDGGPP